MNSISDSKFPNINIQSNINVAKWIYGSSALAYCHTT